MFISLGVSNSLVKDLQNKLVKLGFIPKNKLTNDIKVSGVYDYDTDEFVKHLCNKHGVSYIGSINDDIMTLIDSLLINPLYSTSDSINNKEDFSDTEEYIQNVTNVEETKVCKNIQALIKYIDSFEINREVNTLFLHCTATPQSASVSSIQNYWKSIGWKNPGYHIIVKSNGEWTVLLDFNGVSNGVRGHNSTSINISYIGGMDSKGNPLNNLTIEQDKVFKVIIERLRLKINGLKVRGHNEVSKKACPSFIVKDWLI